jgi:hypothetical protein
MSRVQWQAEKKALDGSGLGSIQLDLGILLDAGAERAAADCDRWPRTGFCGVEGCDVGGRGFGAAVEASVDARAAWAAEAVGVPVAVLEILVWFLVIPRHEQATVHATVHLRGLCGPFVLPIVWAWGACSC